MMGTACKTIKTGIAILLVLWPTVKGTFFGTSASMCRPVVYCAEGARGVLPPKLMMRILNSPYFHKIYKLPPYFR